MPARIGARKLVGSPYCNEARQFFTRLTPPPTAARKKLYDTLIRALVSAGVWRTLDLLHIAAAANSATALTNLVSSKFTASLGGTAPTFTADSGFVPDGISGYIDTGYNPSTAVSPRLTLDDGGAFAWSLSDIASNSLYLLGGTGSSSIYLQPRIVANASTFRLNGGAAGGANTDGRGFYSASRMAPVLLEAYKNGALVQSAAVGTSSVPNMNLTIFRNNTAYYTGGAAAWGYGSQLSAARHLALYSALRTYMTAVGVP